MSVSEYMGESVTIEICGVTMIILQSGNKTYHVDIEEG